MAHMIGGFMKKDVFWVCLMVLAGILFRLWFISLAPQPFGWDQYEYEMYAAKIFAHPWMLASHSYRSYPYPLMLALFYKVVGFGNTRAVFYLQAVLDSLVGLMIYSILRIGWKDKTASIVGLVLYTLNPFTSGYVGVLLAEVLTGFYIAGTDPGLFVPRIILYSPSYRLLNKGFFHAIKIERI